MPKDDRDRTSGRSRPEGKGESPAEVPPGEMTFEMQMQDFETTAQRRVEIPSVREVERGLAADGFAYRPAVATPRADHNYFRKRFGESIRLIDPRGIADARHTRMALGG